jgi:hypothetical protein
MAAPMPIAVVACVFTRAGKQTRTFGTMTADLLQSGDWLEGKGGTHVAIESTSVFWKPVCNELEGLAPDSIQLSMIATRVPVR